MAESTISQKSSGSASSGKPKNVWMIVSVVLAIGLVISIVSASKGGNDPDFTQISSEEAGSTLISFVNDIYAAQIGQSTLKSVTEKNGMYQIVVSVNNAGNDVDQTVYVSKDGKLFIPQALNMADVRVQYQQFLNSGQNIPPAGEQVIPTPTPPDSGLGGTADDAEEDETEE